MMQAVLPNSVADHMIYLDLRRHVLHIYLARPGVKMFCPRDSYPCVSPVGRFTSWFYPVH